MQFVMNSETDAVLNHVKLALAKILLFNRANLFPLCVCRTPYRHLFENFMFHGSFLWWCIYRITHRNTLLRQCWRFLPENITRNRHGVWNKTSCNKGIGSILFFQTLSKVQGSHIRLLRTEQYATWHTNTSYWDFVSLLVCFTDYPMPSIPNMPVLPPSPPH